MAKVDVVRAWVEKLIAEMSGKPAEADGDGDYPFRSGTAAYYVRLLGTDRPVVQVFSVVLRDVRRTPKLLAAINDINTNISFARVFHVRDQVLVETEQLGLTLDAEELIGALDVVLHISLSYGQQLQKEFGGRLTFEDPEAEPDVSPEVAAAATVVHDGLYL